MSPLLANGMLVLPRYSPMHPFQMWVTNMNRNHSHPVSPNPGSEILMHCHFHLS